MATLLMAQPLADDPVGRAVLAEIEQLERDVAAHRGAASVAEFRALLAMRFEDATFIDRTVESPVTMVSLAAATLRRFDAAAVIGADAAHLPAVPDDVLFMSNAVKAELGLVTAEQSLRDQAAQLAALLVTTPRVMVSWATRRGDEPVALSPLLERLQWVSARARGDDMVRDPADERHAVAATAGAAPRPVAPGLLPARISASQAQSMVDCPYQFYARRMLGLVEPDDVVEMPDKRDFGVALHAVLKRFHAHWGETDFNAVGAEQLASSLREHARAVFAPAVERTPGLFAYEHRFAGLVASYVAWLQRHARAGWRWRSGEETHRRRVALDDGRAVELGGRVDRLDSDAAGRVHLIDYKARDAGQLRRGLTPHGEDIQLPFYGLLLPQPPHAAQYLSFDRARDGEGGVQSVPAPGPFEALVGEVGDRLVRDLQRIADGAPLPAIGAPATCRFCEMRGLCRRDHWVADDAGSGVPT
jgi:ATP-dependent helicase/nuclease subunit B